MTPADHGYRWCSRCCVWVPAEAVQPNGNKPDEGWMCLDVAWCSAQAGWGRGAMEADTGDQNAQQGP
jgi:hypothetical protein